ncbi:MAG: TetR family transcriptional regulator [Bdellovibrionaceae bacterium]|nr:TetR family transcriptional regulator [Pseudobdellovibrionaceae bacterium]|tara:strand:- start:810 stop:1409 length:600 start_codon:yes stop_codon:yes gene_type:complete
MGRGTETKTLIIDTAMMLAGKVGLQGLTIGSLAKAVGMSKSGLFAHFNSKDNLQLEVIREASQHFTRIVLKPAFRLPRGEPRVRALVQNWVSYLDDSKTLPGGRILISSSIEFDDQPGEIRDYIHKVQLDLVKSIQKATQIAIDEGHFREDLNTEQFAWEIFSLILGYHHFNKMMVAPQTAKLHQASFEKLVNSARKGG